MPYGMGHHMTPLPGLTMERWMVLELLTQDTRICRPLQGLAW